MDLYQEVYYQKRKEDYVRSTVAFPKRLIEPLKLAQQYLGLSTRQQLIILALELLLKEIETDANT